jgi:hypothetical protein
LIGGRFPTNPFDLLVYPLNQKLKQQYSSSEDHGFHVSNSNYGFACGAVVAEVVFVQMYDTFSKAVDGENT